jgi:DNA mismatch repair protein MutS2
VLAIKSKDADLLIGDLKSTSKISRLEKISKAEFKKETKALEKRSTYQTSEKMMNFSPNLDLRGKRGEEVLPLLQLFIDEGHMLGIKNLRIVHGKGDGILREVTRSLLRTMTPVRKLEDEHADRGGAGVTLVTLA